MDPVTALYVVISFLVILYVYLCISRFPHLPGPGIREYLPGGMVFPMLHDFRTTNLTLLSLAREYGDIFQVWLGPQHTIITAIPADVVQISSNTEDFIKTFNMAVFKDIIPGGLFLMPKEQHKVARKLIGHNFTPMLLKKYHEHISFATEQLCNTLSKLVAQKPQGEPSDVINISHHLAATTFQIIARVAFGCETTTEEECAIFVRTIDIFFDEIMQDVIGFPLRQMFSAFGFRRKLFETKEEVAGMARKFINERLNEREQVRETRPVDVLDALLSIGEQDMDSSISRVIEFAIAGSHTTSHLLEWCIFAICSHPSVQDGIEKEIRGVFGNRPLSERVSFEDIKHLTYLLKIWKETCRRYIGGLGLMRVSAKDITLKGSGVYVPRGTPVVAASFCSHRSKHIWKDPDEFLPERWGTGIERREGDNVPPGAYVPFSIGQRSCPGHFLADHEAILILAELHRRFKFSLGCSETDIISSSSIVQAVTHLVADGKRTQKGLPVRVQMKDTLSE